MANESPILQHFTYEHLPHGEARNGALMFRSWAHQVEENVPNGPEKTVALRKLLESRDAALRILRPSLVP